MEWLVSIDSGSGSSSGSGSGSSSGSGSDSDCPGAEKLHAEWVFKAFGECVDTPLKYIAFFIGLSSILCWLIAQAP